ncbi:MAG TPA: acyl-CoA dehydrogenase family protein [Gordonia sp. (in: high G+C Gram-positive bacteria)]|uniref:acyl-CoA dehydrogenase family protein n=2 Tax=unclassified Gordonia (in: high G+C Gram-positive bacteria) TaxID=2657482 RepID=UPI000FBA7F38|nr:acyl-CoA dehydrogenase family protein [Gordonia sp. (in: high G+C Gram-positive bacteria)]RUP39845.1 MAG: DNA alkylation response protein [Gordonia sp. (in: high G+C Gram-positive bacteria)]HNP56689.1 acyl-CoA dehydrogenase family protein [Gordonia sp. (in: high G+C Gram-positive bacteria)]HRC51943.1 acyl-CoA dehydrogenase family protein [Gordonia sp. (in: high G+C Gram-positive bacteria)]
MKTNHAVVNQVPPLEGFDVANYPVITEYLDRVGAAESLPELHELGQMAGSAEWITVGDLAEEHPPVLETHDRFGNRIDVVRYDPSYHRLMDTAVGHGLAGHPWASADPHAHLVRSAKFSVWTAVDSGHGCPISMTYAVVPALRHNPELARAYEPGLTSLHYQPELTVPTAKRGLIAGMSMTEKQGGSDVRANTTTAVAQADGSFLITGHKWFTSAPNSDLLLVLAQLPEGLSCFFVPRILPDGSRNNIALQRLKNKLGNHSNASSEVEYHEAVGWLVGEPGRGVRTIIEMVNMTRLDCATASAAVMRNGTTAAAHHANYRSAFGAKLVDQPLMRNVLADLHVDAEASTLTALWLADLTDRAMRDERAAQLRRISLAISKYFICKRAPMHAAEALECLGGNGYVEDSRMPRLFRESPLMSIWEGSGNVAALDTLRAIGREPQTLEVLFDELDAATGADRAYDDALAAVKGSFADMSTLEYRARDIVGRLASLLSASLLIRHGHPAVADAYVNSRLDGSWGSVYGTLGGGVDTAALIARATPKV